MVAGLIATLATSVPCRAVLMHAGASDAAHIALGVANSADVLWVKSEHLATVFRFSAIRINDYYAITVAHDTYLQGVGIIKPLEVGTGTNFLTDPGTVRTISAVTVHPAYPGSAGLLPARYYDSQIFAAIAWEQPNFGRGQFHHRRGGFDIRWVRDSGIYGGKLCR